MRRLTFASVALAAGLLAPIAVRAQSTDSAVRLFAAKDYSAARMQFSAIARAEPRNAQAFYYLGRLALIDGDGDAAANWLEKAVSIDDRNASYHAWLGRAYGRQVAHVSKFRQFFIARHIVAEFERAVALDPNDVDARSNLLEFYAVAPSMVGGDIGKAKAQAIEIARRDPFRGQLANGVIAASTKDRAGAERSYVAAVTQYPDSALGYSLLGSFYQSTGDYDKAFATFDKLLARHPNDGVGLYGIGRTASVSKTNIDRGIQSLTEYVSTTHAPDEPSLASAHYRLGLLYEAKGDRDRARQEYTTVLRLDPKQNDAKDALKRVR